jgi:hypothetical protein
MYAGRRPRRVWPRGRNPRAASVAIRTERIARIVGERHERDHGAVREDDRERRFRAGIAGERVGEQRRERVARRAVGHRRTGGHGDVARGEGAPLQVRVGRHGKALGVPNGLEALRGEPREVRRAGASGMRCRDDECADEERERARRPGSHRATLEQDSREGKPPSKRRWTRRSRQRVADQRRTSGRSSRSSSAFRSAETASSAATPAAAIISAAPTRWPAKTCARSPVSIKAAKNVGAARPPAAVPTA